MGFVAKELAQGSIAAGSTGANTVYTVPGSTTAHVIHMTLRFASTSDSATVEAGPSGSERPVAKAKPETGFTIVDVASGQGTIGTTGDMENPGTIGNKIIETGGKIIINKQGSNDVIEFSISGYEIT